VDGGDQVLTLLEVLEGLVEPGQFEDLIQLLFAHAVSDPTAEYMHFEHRLSLHRGQGYCFQGLAVLVGGIRHPQVPVILLVKDGLWLLDGLTVFIKFFFGFLTLSPCSPFFLYLIFLFFGFLLLSFLFFSFS